MGRINHRNSVVDQLGHGGELWVDASLRPRGYIDLFTASNVTCQQTSHPRSWRMPRNEWKYLWSRLQCNEYPSSKILYPQEQPRDFGFLGDVGDAFTQ